MTTDVPALPAETKAERHQRIKETIVQVLLHVDEVRVQSRWQLKDKLGCHDVSRTAFKRGFGAVLNKYRYVEILSDYEKGERVTIVRLTERGHASSLATAKD